MIGCFSGEKGGRDVAVLQKHTHLQFADKTSLGTTSASLRPDAPGAFPDPAPPRSRTSQAVATTIRNAVSGDAPLNGLT
ncbi:MAG: hypothetical protein EBV06_03795 [Planctomycetia bacterium]|nr:hypothetical protein [Planctomycetia bacterium]